MLADGLSCRKLVKTEVTAHHLMDGGDEGRHVGGLANLNFILTLHADIMSILSSTGQ